MAQAKTSKEIFNFSKGLVTEVNPFLFPEDGATDLENIDITKRGVVQRRLGMDYQAGFTLNASPGGTPDTQSSWLGTYLWKNAGESGEDFYVIWNAGTLFFHEADNGTIGAFVDSVNISASVTNAERSKLDFTELKGYLICSWDGLPNGLSPVQKITRYPRVVEYQGSNVFAENSSLQPEVRDIWGVDDGFAVDFRPATALGPHGYNLQNQGWDKTTPSKVSQFMTDTSNAGNVAPSNADIMHLGRDDTVQPPIYTANQFYDKIININFGTTPAPKGRTIIGIADSLAVRNAVETATNVEWTPYYPSVTENFAGRLWYGFNTTQQGTVATTVDDLQPVFRDIIAYSQTVDGLGDMIKCYQNADPTSETDPDLVDTDGGTITVPGMGNCLALHAIGNTLLVFGETGIWSIAGPSDGVFSATSFEVNKVSDIVVEGVDTIVTTTFGVMFWGTDAIYTINIEPTVGRFTVQTLTRTTIQEEYNNIPFIGKRAAVGVFSSLDNQVRWLYSNQYSYRRFDRELVLDLDSSGFTKHEFKDVDTSNGAYVAGYLPEYRPDGTTQQIYLVIEMVGGPAQNNDYTFATQHDDTFVDFFSRDSAGELFTSFVETGQYTEGDSQRTKQAQYLTTHFYRTELTISGTDPNFVLDNQSSCMMTAKFDFSDHENSGQESIPQEVYRLHRNVAVDAAGPFNYGHEIITTRNVVSGSGRVMRLRFESGDNKDFKLIGWGMNVTGQTNV